MTSRLEVLRAERDQIEGRDDWANPALGYLNDTIEALERAEKAKAPAPTPASTTAPAGDPLQALQAEMQAAVLAQAAGKPVDVDALMSRWNAQLADIGRSREPADLYLEREDVRFADTRRPPEATDLAQLQRELLAADANPGTLSDAERAALLRRYNRATPGRRPTEALRTDLAGQDLTARMRAAVELQRRGELDDGVADELVSAFNDEVKAANERGLDPAELPEEFRPAAVAMQAELKRLQAAERDPTDTALAMYNDAVRAAKPPTLERQLEALGVQVEPEPAGEGQ